MSDTMRRILMAQARAQVVAYRARAEECRARAARWDEATRQHEHWTDAADLWAQAAQDLLERLQ